jgi:hypothetical protein
MKAFIGVLLLVAISMAQEMDKKRVYGELGPLFARYAKNFPSTFYDEFNRRPENFSPETTTFSPETLAAIYRLLQQNNFDFTTTIPRRTTINPFTNFWWNKHFNPTTVSRDFETPTWFEKMAIERFFKKFIFDDEFFNPTTSTNTGRRFFPTKPFVTEVKTDVVVEAPRDIETEQPFVIDPITREIKYKPIFGDFKKMSNFEREIMGKPTFEDMTVPFWFKKFFGKTGEEFVPTTTTLFDTPVFGGWNGKRVSMVRPTTEEQKLKTLITLFLEKEKLNKFQDLNKFKTIYTPKDMDFEMIKNLPLFESLDKMKYTNVNDKKFFDENLEKVKEILNKDKVDFSDLMKVAPFLEKVYTKMTPLEKMEKMEKMDKMDKMEKMIKAFPTEEIVY